jgi:glycosyltransferase involved in cell wall biosynthesis
LRIINRRPFSTASYLAALFVFLLRNLRRFDLACVHLAYFQADVAVIAGLITRRPIWVKLAASGAQGEIERMRRFAWLTGYVGLRSAMRVQATSDSIAREAMMVGVRAERLVAVPNGVDAEVYRPPSSQEKQRLRAQLGLLENCPVVLFVGRLAQHKGIRDLLTAWSLLGEPAPATLAMVGSAATMDPISIPETDGVVVRPWTTNVSAYYQAADIFVLPSHVEGMSNAMLEAMACGLPVICTRVGAAESIIQQGQNGLLVPVGEPRELAAGLRALIADATMRRRLGDAAARTVQDRFSIGRVADMLEAEYRRIALEA